VVVAASLIVLRNLFTVVIVFAIYNLLSAALFVLLDAVDVALTEAAVGAGIMTILMLGTLVLTSSKERKSGRHGGILPVLIIVITGAALIYGTLDMPHFGDPEAPTRGHVIPRYIEESPTEIGIPNMVTSVLASYRGFDTLGEVLVIFIAGVGVLILFATGGPRRSDQGRENEP
jgi:multicomponent Na+:H+ antiporter subunit B